MKGLRMLRSDMLPTPAVVFIVAFAVSVTVAAYFSHITKAQDAERFEHVITQAQDSLSGRLETYIAMMRAGAGMVASQDGAVDREEFHRFAEQLRLAQRYPGVQGIGYTVRLPGREVATAERALATYGVPELELYPPGEREEIHAIVHLEPLDRRNLAALGYDMFSQPVRRAAMERARDTGQPAASGRVQLVQEIDRTKQAGFLIYVPVYHGGDTPTTIEQRRRDLIGFVYSPFRADDLMRGIFGTSPRPRLSLEVFDGEPSSENLLHRSQVSEPAAPRYTTTRTLEVAGRPWSIRYVTRPEFELSSGRGFVPYVLAAGLLGTLLLTLLTWLQARARRKALDAATGLRATARKLEVLHGIAARLSAELDSDRLIQAVTDAGRELSGAEIGAFFYNVLTEGGEGYRLYTLSGAPREAFANLGMPRNTHVFGPTFRGEGVVRADNITTDARFGQNAPFNGFPPGHWPVRSYLAVPVMSRAGTVIGGLFFGHSQIGVFSADAERSVTALAAHAAIAIDNARLFKATQEEIAARKRIEEHQKLLLDELNHRVKNTLAIVQSIAAQTLRTSSAPAEFQRAFEARLIALSEAHNLLSSANWRGVMLHDLIRRELAPHGLENSKRITLSGPQLWLPPATGVALGMALHELTTNAARHGSLASPGGRLEVSWTVSETTAGREFRLVWQEGGGPPLEPPKRRGFGTRMIERGLAHDLQGEAKLYFERSGLKCVIEATLPREVAAA